MPGGNVYFPYTGGRYFPYAGLLGHNPAPYRVVTLGVGEEFTLPPNVAAISSDSAFTLKLPDGTSIPFASPPTTPISIEAIYPKGDFVISSGAGGPGNYSLYAHP